MSSETTRRIKAYSTDYEQTNSLLALMDWYGATNLRDITEEQGREFLAMLESGRIRIPREGYCI